jgi:hypothetical protein
MVRSAASVNEDGCGACQPPLPSCASRGVEPVGIAWTE